jgi:hypothetical protein
VFHLFSCFKAGRKRERSGQPTYFVAYNNAERLKEIAETCTGVPPYPLIQYPWFQLSTVHCSPEKKFEN